MVGAGRRQDGLNPPPPSRLGELTRLGRFTGIEAPVVVACSGGTDSLALLALSVAAGLEPVAVHVDHGARPGSAAEAGLVAGFAAALGAGFAGERVEVAPGPDFEARARAARYGALERARARLRARAILVGHTRDDQAETVLLNLLRGGAVPGLAGIPPRRGPIVRPLLEVSRAELTEVCARLGLAPIEDPMNADVVHRRVWLRREAIPALERGADRDLRPVLARQAAVAREESELLDEMVYDALAAGTGQPGPTGRLTGAGTFRADAMAALPLALARRAVRLWLGPPPPSLDHTDAVLAVARGERRAVELPDGVRVVRAGGCLHRVDPEPDRTAWLPVPISLPGRAEGLGLSVEAWVERAAPLRWPDGRWTAVVDADRAGDRALLRPSQPGERFQPLGLSGHKLVSDALAEAGVPAERRPGHPVLTTPSGETLWVLGYRIDDHVRVSGHTRRFLWLSAEAGGSRG